MRFRIWKILLGLGGSHFRFCTGSYRSGHDLKNLHKCRSLVLIPRLFQFVLWSKDLPIYSILNITIGAVRATAGVVSRYRVRLHQKWCGFSGLRLRLRNNNLTHLLLSCNSRHCPTHIIYVSLRQVKLSTSIYFWQLDYQNINLEPQCLCATCFQLTTYKIARLLRCIRD
jgi:hypothetical protein